MTILEDGDTVYAVMIFEVTGGYRETVGIYVHEEEADIAKEHVLDALPEEDFATVRIEETEYKEAE